MAVIMPTSNCDVNLDRLKLTSESIKRRVEESTFFRCRPKALNAIDYTESSSFDCLRAKRPYNNVIWPWPSCKAKGAGALRTPAPYRASVKLHANRISLKIKHNYDPDVSFGCLNITSSGFDSFINFIQWDWGISLDHCHVKASNELFGALSRVICLVNRNHSMKLLQLCFAFITRRHLGMRRQPQER